MTCGQTIADFYVQDELFAVVLGMVMNGDDHFRLSSIKNKS